MELFWVLVGILALFAGLFNDLPVKTIVLLLIAAIIIAIVVSKIAKRYYRYQILSAQDEIGGFRHPLECDFDQIYALDKSVFTQADLIPPETFRQWFRVNKKVFTVLSVGEKVIGYYSILPLRQATFNRFLKGKISEIDFTAKDILSEQEARNIRRIYFFSIVIDKEYRHRGYQLLQHAVDELDARVTYPQVRKIYATAATPDGKRILEKRGFIKKANAAERIDRHDLYEYSYDDQSSSTTINHGNEHRRA